MSGGGEHSALRPSREAAEAAWADMVRADRDQVERLSRRPRPEDFYAPVAESFRADPRRTGDVVLDHLLSLVLPGETWIDVGAGGGRYCLPLALRAGRLYAVEPSEGMRRVLAESMAEFGILNVDVYPERWPGESRAPVADVALISHVGNDIEPIGPFLDQLEVHARRLCMAVFLERAPVSDFAPLWKPVHGEARFLLPGLREFIVLTLARGRLPDVRLFHLPPRRFERLEDLHRAARRPLWVLEGSDEDARLGRAIEAMAVPVEGGFALSAEDRRLGVVCWRPRAGS